MGGMQRGILHRTTAEQALRVAGVCSLAEQAQSCSSVALGPLSVVPFAHNVTLFNAATRCILQHLAQTNFGLVIAAVGRNFNECKCGGKRVRVSVGEYSYTGFEGASGKRSLTGCSCWLEVTAESR